MHLLWRLSTFRKKRIFLVLPFVQLSVAWVSMFISLSLSLSLSVFLSFSLSLSLSLSISLSFSLLFSLLSLSFLLSFLSFTDLKLDIQRRLRFYDASESEVTSLKLSIHAAVGAGKLLCFDLGGIDGQYEFYPTGPIFKQLDLPLSKSKSGDLCVSEEAWGFIKVRFFVVPVLAFSSSDSKSLHLR